MNYLNWLRSEGIKFDKMVLTETRARELAGPVKDPATAPIEDICRVVVHHSATASGSASAFRVLHRGVNGWNDIGYHFVIGNGTHSGDGEVETGRALPFAGAHALGANENSIGICLVGNFNSAEPSPKQVASLAQLLAELMAEYGLKKDSITLHRFVKGSFTECPGKLLTLAKIVNLIVE